MLPVRVPPFIVATTLMLLDFVISDHGLPQATLEVKVYRRLSDTSFRLMRKEAEAFSEATGLGTAALICKVFSCGQPSIQACERFL